MSTIITSSIPVAQRLTTNFYSNTTGSTGPNQLSFPVSVGNQAFEAQLNIGGGTGGMRLGVAVPSGAAIYSNYQGVSTGINDQAVNMLGPGLVVSPFGVAGATGPALISGLITSAAGVTGICQIQMGAMAATGPTGFIGTGSYLIVFPST